LVKRTEQSKERIRGDLLQTGAHTDEQRVKATSETHNQAAVPNTDRHSINSSISSSSQNNASVIENMCYAK